MKIVLKTKIERDVIHLADFELIRLKSYNSKTGETTIYWKYMDGMEDVGEGFTNRLERKFIKMQRNKSSITL